MALEHGQIRALIWAPPRLFFVNTPSSTAIDLGARIRSTSTIAGGEGSSSRAGGSLSNTTAASRSSRRTRSARPVPGVGPGTPCYQDAPAGFADALTILDFSPTRTSGARRRSTPSWPAAPERRVHAVAPAVARDRGGAGPGLRSDGRPRAPASGGHARRHRPRRDDRRALEPGGTSSVSTAWPGGDSGSRPETWRQVIASNLL